MPAFSRKPLSQQQAQGSGWPEDVVGVATKTSAAPRKKITLEGFGGRLQLFAHALARLVGRTTYGAPGSDGIMMKHLLGSPFSMWECPRF